MVQACSQIPVKSHKATSESRTLERLSNMTLNNASRTSRPGNLIKSLWKISLTRRPTFPRVLSLPKLNFKDTEEEQRMNPDPLGVPIKYLWSHDVFDPILMAEYRLCHFYNVRHSGDLPDFLEPCVATTAKHVHCLLRKAHF